jgi:imidazolonepropionase-like amidohydrolase
VLRSATLVGAEVVGLAGKLGELVPGAFADLLAVAGNPLEDLMLLQEQGRRIPLIMKGGKIVKNELGPG